MFTVSDIIHLIQYYYKSSTYEGAAADVETLRLESLRGVFIAFRHNSLKLIGLWNKILRKNSVSNLPRCYANTLRQHFTMPQSFSYKHMLAECPSSITTRRQGMKL